MVSRLVFLALIGAALAVPNYITEEEFARARLNPFVPNNNVSLLLSPYKKPNIVQPRPGFGVRFWNNAEVPYTLDPNFTAQQRDDIARAFEEFHSKTCIRFVPKDNHTSWVDIMYDANVCGEAQSCMNHGGQPAKFGGACVNPGTMVHEFGHTLCMSHETSRMDRDNWITFNTHICQEHVLDGPEFNRGLHKLYDYGSVEHFENECQNGCITPKVPGVSRCGSGGILSVLDAEILNEMYECPGCHSYRYMNANHTEGLINPFVAGDDIDGSNLYACRVYQGGDIVPGKWNLNSGECHVAFGGTEFAHSENIEVLCNPDLTADMVWVNSTTLPSNAMKGGRTNSREDLYVIRCQHVGYWMPGKYIPGVGAFTSYHHNEIFCTTYEFLVCNS